MAIFDGTTTTSAKGYYLERLDMSGFLIIINTRWIIYNSEGQFSPNIFGNAIVKGMIKPIFSFHLQIGLKIDVNAQCLV